jgi:hypothetical protein
MYCPSCGTAVINELNYCNRCGGNLSLVKDNGATKPATSSAESIGEDIFWTTVFGLGLIFGGVVAMRALDVGQALIIAYMVLSSLAFIGLYALDMWRFIRAHRSSQGSSTTAQVEKLETKELDAESVYALPEPMPSVTENTTRAFEPVHSERKSR